MVGPQARGSWLMLAFFSLFISTFVHAQNSAQSTAQTVQNLTERSRFAVVKLIVEGRDPDDKYKKTQGSGFFIFSGAGLSLILTAAHVIGSSETSQEKNPDWKVENGAIVRKISLLSLDEKGSLILRSTEVSPGPPFPSGLDVALLQIHQTGYTSLPLAKQYSDVSGLHDVLLLGFEGDKSELPIPPITGMGQLNTLSTFDTTVYSRPGQSGGPWIDLRSGLVVAVAKGIQSGPGGPSLEATPTTAVTPFLAPYLPSPPVKAVYKICAGEYKALCPSDAIYQYCYFNVEDWAKNKCTAYSINRLATFGGNKCGYAIDEVVCELK